MRHRHEEVPVVSFAAGGVAAPADAALMISIGGRASLSVQYFQVRDPVSETRVLLLRPPAKNIKILTNL